MPKIKKPKTSQDKSLGLNSKILRRDFLNSTLLGAGSALFSMSSPIALSARSSIKDGLYMNLPQQVNDDWYGYGGVGDSKKSHGNTPDTLKVAHAVRDSVFSPENIKNLNVLEQYDLVIVGAGLSGLGAAQRLKEIDSNKKCLILDNHPIFGGEAKRNEFNIKGQVIAAPQGSNSFYYKTKYE